MNCRDFDVALRAYLERRLAPAERAAADQHLAACGSCAELLERMRRTTCEVLTRFLDEYVDGGLASDQKSVFERHLALCPPCVEFVRSYRATVRLGRAALGDPGALLPQVPEELLRAVLDARSRRP